MLHSQRHGLELGVRPEQVVVGVRREPRRDAGRLQQTPFINKTAVASLGNVRAREVAVRRRHQGQARLVHGP